MGTRGCLRRCSQPLSSICLSIREEGWLRRWCGPERAQLDTQRRQRRRPSASAPSLPLAPPARISRLRSAACDFPALTPPEWQSPFIDDLFRSHSGQTDEETHSTQLTTRRRRVTYPRRSPPAPVPGCLAPLPRAPRPVRSVVAGPGPAAPCQRHPADQRTAAAGVIHPCPSRRHRGRAAASASRP